jgi:flagellar P-ring protein FlgI
MRLPRIELLRDVSSVSLLLHNPDYATARGIAAALNKELGNSSARAVDSRRVEISGIAKGPDSVPILLARLEELQVQFSTPAKVVINERTGTAVMGADVTLGPCSILHGNLAIEVVTQLEVSQPQPLAQGQTQVVPQAKLLRRAFRKSGRRKRKTNTNSTKWRDP